MPAKEKERADVKADTVDTRSRAAKRAANKAAKTAANTQAKLAAVREGEADMDTLSGARPGEAQRLTQVPADAGSLFVLKPNDGLVANSAAARQPKAPSGGTDGDGRDYSKPWKKRPLVGAYTGAPRVPYPKVFRPFGSNTRQRVVGDRSHITHMTHLGYAKGIVESKPVPPLLPPHAPLGTRGTSAVNSGVPALRPGSHHLLFATH